MHVTLIYRGSGLVWGSLGRAKPVGPSSSRASNCDSSTTTNVLFNAPTTNMSALRILVPVKRVIDYAVKPRVNKAQTAIETNGVKHSMNPFDELSIEESVRIREKKSAPGGVEEILAFSAGPTKSQDILRTAMAMGADRSLLVEMKDGEELEPLGVAKLLQKVVEKEKSNLVFLGKQSIDDDAGQTGQMLAGLLGWSQATQASKVVFKDGDIVEVTKEVDGGTDVVRGKLPMVITTDLRLNEPRYASLQSIMKAKKKKLEKSTLGDWGVDGTKRLKTLKVIEPPPRQGGGKVDDVDGMISKLKELGAL
ncbi:putative electron transfer flavoprotein beta-subunit protein [Botrytis cinerea BcDW1]|nr:putative electron transfer flavoprotein beta-subunit protein [Botrytis cinerea BcDW1]